MSDDYRKPATPDAPRARVVRRADPPDGESDEAWYRALRAEHAEEVRAERDRSRRSAAIGMRVLGAVLIALATIVLLTYREEIAITGTLRVSSHGAAVLGLGATLGTWLLAFGNGGVATMHETPLWYRWGAALLACVTSIAMVSGAALPLLVALLEQTL